MVDGLGLTSQLQRLDTRLIWTSAGKAVTMGSSDSGELKMRVNALDHVNIRTRDMAGSARFYEELFGLKARNGPASLPPERVQWLYDYNERPIIHLNRYDCEPGPTGSIHHIALSCSGKNEMLKRLKLANREFSLSEIPAAGLSQIFTRDPNGILLELNFLGE